MRFRTPSNAALVRTVVPIALTLLLFQILLLLPADPEQFNLEHFLRLPLELPAWVLLLLLTKQRPGRWLRCTVVLLTGLLVLLGLGDLGSRLAFGRSFSPLTEWHLVTKGWALAADSVGLVEAISIALAAVGLLMLLLFLLYRGLGRIGELQQTRRRTATLTFGVILGIGLAALLLQSTTGRDLRVISISASTMAERLDRTRQAVEDQLAFQEALGSDPLSNGPAPRFTALDGIDVIVLFVESYGRSFTESPRFAEDADHRLRSIQDQLHDAGVSAVSGYIDSPIRGGRSWLAQASFASGLMLTNQARFDRLITSDRQSLWSLLGDAGWSTSVVLPVVSDHWVEGAWYDVDRFFDRDALQYAGRDFGFITMPDQYTLSAFHRLVRNTAPGPLAAEIGLLGSHAPWTPLAKPVPWEDVGDGSIFDGSQRFGEPLDWADPEPVRRMYGLSVESTLQLVADYIERHGDDALFIVLGDHQPAYVIDGWAGSSHVPIHVISANTELLARFPQENFSAGMLPAAELDALPMASMRDLLARQMEAPLGSIVPVSALPGDLRDSRR